MKDYTDKAWIIVIILCVVFWVIGCTMFEPKEEVETFPYPEEDPILEKLIELNEIETI